MLTLRLVATQVAARAMRVFLKLFQDRKREAAQDRPTALSRDGLNYQLVRLRLIMFTRPQMATHL
jgi:hypothetical protein